MSKRSTNNLVGTPSPVSVDPKLSRIGAPRAARRKCTTSGADGAEPTMQAYTLPPISLLRKLSMTACTGQPPGAVLLQAECTHPSAHLFVEETLDERLAQVRRTKSCCSQQVHYRACNLVEAACLAA